MNKVILTGKIINDTELLKSKNDKNYTIINLMVKKDYKNKDNVRENEFFRLILFNKKAEMISKYFKKGDSIELEGVLINNKYVNKHNEKMNVINIRVDKFMFPYKVKTDNINSSQRSQEENDIENENNFDDYLNELFKDFEEIESEE